MQRPRASPTPRRRSLALGSVLLLFKRDRARANIPQSSYVATGGIQPREEPYTTALASTETRHLLLTSGDESGRVHGRRYAFANYVLPVVVHLGARNHRRHCAARPSRRENTSDDGASAGVSGERLGLGAWGLPARGQAPELRAEPRAGAKGPGGLAAVHRSRRGHCGPP